MLSCPYYIPKNINIDISAFDTVPKDYALKKYTAPHRIIVNYPATIVFWNNEVNGYKHQAYIILPLNKRIPGSRRARA